MARRGPQTGVGVVCKKRIDLVRAFLAENRTGAVEQPAARLAPAATAPPAAWPAARASCSMSLSRRSQRTSGWRRTMPEAVQGASSRMASKAWPSHHCCRPRRVGHDHLGAAGRGAARVSSMRRLRAASTSSAVSSIGRRAGAIRAGAPSCRPARRRRRARAAARRAPARSRPSEQQRRGQLCGGVLHRALARRRSPAAACTGRARASCTPLAATGHALADRTACSARW